MRVFWESEESFVDDFVASAPQSGSGSNRCMRIWREMRTGYGRPDVVVVRYTPEALVRRRENSFSNGPLSTEAAYAMAYLSERRWVSQDCLGVFLHSGGRRVDRIVHELLDRRLILTKEHLVKACPRADVLAVNQLWVFEAKLHHWQGAVQQAERHLWFTHDSYVLMPPKQERLARSIGAECVRRGIGLNLFSRERGWHTALRPRQSGFINSPLLWIINEQLLSEENSGTRSLRPELARIDGCVPTFEH